MLPAVLAKLAINATLAMFAMLEVDEVETINGAPLA